MGESPGVHAGTDRMLCAGRMQSTQTDCSKRLTGYQAASTMGCQRRRPRTTWHEAHLARRVLLQAGRVCSRRLHRASQVRRSAAGGCIATARVHHFAPSLRSCPTVFRTVVGAACQTTCHTTLRSAPRDKNGQQPQSSGDKPMLSPMPQAVACPSVSTSIGSSGRY